MLQTPIIAAVTGINTNEGVAQLRCQIVDILLEKDIVFKVKDVPYTLSNRGELQAAIVHARTRADRLSLQITDTELFQTVRGRCITSSMKWWTTRSTRCWPGHAIGLTSRFILTHR